MHYVLWTSLILLPKDRDEIEIIEPVTRSRSQSTGGTDVIDTDFVDSDEDAELPPPVNGPDSSLLADEKPFYEDERAVDDRRIQDEDVNLNQLIAKLTSTKTRDMEGQDVAKQNPEFVKAFLASYRSIMSPAKLLAKIWQRSLVPQDNIYEQSEAVAPLLNVLGQYRSLDTAIDNSDAMHATNSVNESDSDELLATFTALVNAQVLVAVRQWIVGYFAIDSPAIQSYSRRCTVS